MFSSTLRRTVIGVYIIDGITLSILNLALNAVFLVTYWQVRLLLLAFFSLTLRANLLLLLDYKFRFGVKSSDGRVIPA